MSNPQGQNDNLLSFLKNQSLFNGSPTRKMSSRSRDRKSERNRSPGANQQYQGNYNMNASYNNNGPNVQYDNNRVVNTSYQTGGNYGTQGGSLQVGGGLNGGNYNTTTTTTYNGGNLGAQGQVGATYSSSIQGGNLRNSYEGGNYNTTTTTTNAIETGLLSTAVAVANQKTYASSFESARVETAQRLEGLAQKVKNEINNLNYKLEMFNSQMISVVTQEYNEIKERIYQVVEETFRNSEGWIQEYMKSQEMKFAEEIIRAKEALMAEMSHIDAMREDINKPYWRNMAGVFITSEFENKIYEVIRMCENVQARKFEMDNTGYRLRDLERYLVDAVRSRLEQLRDVEWGR